MMTIHVTMHANISSIFGVARTQPLFDKSKMATFERYFLDDKETYKEEKGNHFQATRLCRGLRS